MNRNILVVIFIIAAYFAVHKLHQPYLKNVTISLYPLWGPLSDYKVEQKSQIDRCFTKKNCILIYVAPWCPACHEFLKQYPQLNQVLLQKNIGTLIIVGNDEMRANEIALKDKLGENAILDTVQGDFRRQNHVTFYPTFIVTDSKGEVIASGSDGVKKMNQFLREQ